MNTGRFDEAEALLNGARSTFPTDVGLVIDLAWVSYRRPDLPEALRRWAALREDDPDHPAGWTGAIVTLRDAADMAAANDMAQAALAKFPNDPSVLVESGWLAMRRRAFAEAVSWWEDLRKQAPALQPGYIGGAQALIELRRFDEAETILQAALERFGDDRALAIDLARVATARGDREEAVLRWHAARTHFPAHLGVILGEVAALREVRRFDEAEILLSDVAVALPNEPVLAMESARIAQRRGDLSEALHRWKKARGSFPDQAACYTGEAATLRDLGRLEEAETLLQEGNHSLPKRPMATRRICLARPQKSRLDRGASSVGCDIGAVSGNPNSRECRGCRAARASALRGGGRACAEGLRALAHRSRSPAQFAYRVRPTRLA